MERKRRSALKTLARARLAAWIIMGAICVIALIVGLLVEWLVGALALLVMVIPTIFIVHRLMFKMPQTREHDVVDEYVNTVLSSILGRYGLKQSGAPQDPEILIRESGIMPPHTDLEYPEWLSLRGDAMRVTLGSLYVRKARGPGIPPKRVFEGLMMVAKFKQGIDGVVMVWDSSAAPGVSKPSKAKNQTPHDETPNNETTDTAEGAAGSAEEEASETKIAETPFDRMFDVRADPDTLSERFLLPDVRERLVELRTALGPSAAGFRIAVRNDTLDMLVPVMGGPFGKLDLNTSFADAGRVARLLPILRALVATLGAMEMAMVTAL